MSAATSAFVASTAHRFTTGFLPASRGGSVVTMKHCALGAGLAIALMRLRVDDARRQRGDAFVELRRDAQAESVGFAARCLPTGYPFAGLVGWQRTNRRRHGKK